MTESFGQLGGAHAASTPTMPLAGVMVQPFPEPGAALLAAMAQLQKAGLDPPDGEQALHELTQMARPWDPGTCAGRVRTELWAWLDHVAIWVNEQHLWNVTRPGIPECWPAHPHLVQDIAVLACSRYFTRFAVTPAALQDWHHFELPGFLERLRDRLGDGCQPSRHQPRPRRERDQRYAAEHNRRAREQRYADDVIQATEEAGGTALQQRW